MKKKIFISILCLTLSAFFLCGCDVNVGVKSRNDINVMDKFSRWSSNWTDDIYDWADDLSDLSDNMDLNFGNSEKNSNRKVYEENLDTSLDISDIDNISIDTIGSNVIIQAIDEPEFTIQCVGTSKVVTDTSVEKKGNSILVKENKVNGYSHNMNLGDINVKRTVTIGIPKSYSSNISLTYGAGNLTLDKINCDELTIDGGAGTLKINDILFKDLSLTQGVGMSTIDLPRKCGDIDIEGGVGNIDVTLGEVGGDLTFEGGVGDVTISIPDNSPVRINTESGVGHRSITAKTSGENTYSFDLAVGVGNLTVK